MNVALTKCYVREEGFMSPGKVGKFGFGGLWSLGRWEQCQKRILLGREERQREHTHRYEMSAQRHISGLTGVLGTWFGWGGEKLRPEEKVGQIIWALDGTWTILSLILSGNWEPRKAASSRPVLTQLGPPIVFNNWDSDSIVVQREEGTCGAV